MTAELESLLQSDTLSSDDRMLVMQAIVDFKSKPRSKSSELKKARIVGCTCASLTKSIMDDLQFDIIKPPRFSWGFWLLVWDLILGVWGQESAVPECN